MAAVLGGRIFAQFDAADFAKSFMAALNVGRGDLFRKLLLQRKRFVPEIQPGPRLGTGGAAFGMLGILLCIACQHFRIGYVRR